MELRVLSHINADGDLLEAWFKHYRRLGASSFHLIVHGPRDENERLYALKDSHPVVIEDAYQGTFHSEEKKRRLNSLLARMRGQWVVVADSDEFVEFPYRSIAATVWMLRLIRRNALFAPMLQHLTVDGSLDTPEVVTDPFRTFPLCSVDLYQIMGVGAAITKWPLFYCTDRTQLQEGGNHSCPIGNAGTSMQGVTHHFKFRRSISLRLSERSHSAHPWRHESAQFRNYLETHGNLLPTEGAFVYSRDSLVRRGLLRKFTGMMAVRSGLRAAGRMLGAGGRAPSLRKSRTGTCPGSPAR
jgi:Glycosyl transferase family 2